MLVGGMGVKLVHGFECVKKKAMLPSVGECAGRGERHLRPPCERRSLNGPDGTHTPIHTNTHTQTDHLLVLPNEALEQ